MATYVAIKDLGKTSAAGGQRTWSKVFGASLNYGAVITENGFYCENGGAGDELDVLEGDAFIVQYGASTAFDTLFHVWSDDTETVVVEENISGQDRIDSVILYVDIPTVDDTLVNNPGALKIVVVKGTPAGSPVPPTEAEIAASVVGANPYFVIWTQDVPDDFVSLASPDDVREWGSISLGGQSFTFNQTNNRWEFGAMFRTYDFSSGIVASTTQTQGQRPLTKTLNVIATVANTNDTVTMPSADNAGMEVIIINNGANTLKIYPASGDNLGAGVNTSVTLTAGSNRRYVSIDTTNWEIV